MQNHHETDPKQQCDRDANDATKSFDAESYDFYTVWPGPNSICNENIRIKSFEKSKKKKSKQEKKPCQLACQLNSYV